MRAQGIRTPFAPAPSAFPKASGPALHVLQLRAVRAADDAPVCPPVVQVEEEEEAAGLAVLREGQSEGRGSGRTAADDPGSGRRELAKRVADVRFNAEIDIRNHLRKRRRPGAHSPDALAASPLRKKYPRLVRAGEARQQPVSAHVPLLLLRPRPGPCIP